MPNNKIAIALVSHGQEEFVLSLLGMLDKLVADTDFEVIIIDNLIPGISLPREKFPFLIKQYRNEVPLGLSENINRAFKLRSKDAEYFCIINPDVEISESIFPSLLACMNDFSIDLISPLVLDHTGQVQDSFRTIPTPLGIIMRRLFPFLLPEINLKTLPDVIYPEWIAGLFILVKASVFEKIGGFNPGYKLYFEDVEFCIKAQLQGFKVAVLTETVIIHDAQHQSRKSFRYLFYHLESAIRFFLSPTYRNFRKHSRV